MPLLAELDLVDHLADVTGVAIKALKEGQGLIDGELLGKLGVLQLDAEQLLELTGIGFPSTAQHLHATRVGAEKSLADLDGGGFPGAIGSEQAEALAGF